MSPCPQLDPPLPVEDSVPRRLLGEQLSLPSNWSWMIPWIPCCEKLFGSAEQAPDSRRCKAVRDVIPYIEDVAKSRNRIVNFDDPSRLLLPCS